MAATTLSLPRTTLTMDEGRIVRWLKGPGDAVQSGEAVAEMETDKTTVEVEATADGYLRRILVAEGETAEVGAAIAVITATPDEPVEGGAAPAEEARQVPREAASSPGLPEPPPPLPAAATPPGGSLPSGGRLRASPAVRRRVRREGLDLTGIRGTGPSGRILMADLEAHLQAAPAPVAAAPQAARTPAAPGMRAAIGRAMLKSWREQPQFEVTRRVDMSEIALLREVVGPSFKASRNVSLSFTDFLVQAFARTLAEHPALNGTVDETGAAVRRDEVNVGLAVALEDGLVVPVIRRADTLTLSELAQARRQVTDRALQGRLAAGDLGGGTFTISNLGPFGVDQFQAIVNPGEAAIAAVGKIEETPVARGGEVVVRPLMAVTLSIDHRAADGAQGARFLDDVVRRLESREGWVLF